MWLWIFKPELSQLILQLSLFSLYAVFKTAVSVWSVVVTFPCAIHSNVSITTSLPMDCNLSCNFPAFSSGWMGVVLFNIMAPVSILSSIKKVVTPVSFSPFINAQLIGAAPLYCGNKDAWRLNVPYFGIFHTASGSILNATTTCKFAL